MDLIQLISSELIKPSSSTTPSPQTLKSFKLCNNKSLTRAPSLYVPLTLYYPAKPRALFNVGFERAQVMKQSLSQTLTRFYPLAGKIKSGFGCVSVDCDDSGLFYVEARVKCNMSRFLKRPDFSLMDGFLSVEENGEDEGCCFHVAKIQVNIFECGGIAVSVLISQFVDGGVMVSLSDFLKDWAATAKGICCQNAQARRPDYATSCKELDLTRQECFNKGKAMTKRLIFDSEAIASLKAITMSSMVQNPTTIEAVSSLIWKCTMDQSVGIGSKSNMSSSFTLSTRTRKMVTVAAALCKDESKTELHDLVYQLRGAITKSAVNLCLEKACHEDLDNLVCYGWCGSGLYEVDFGWGRPGWVTSNGSSRSNVSGERFCNSIVLVDTRWGDGVEAWVTLDENRMDDLLRSHELLTFASAS